MTHRHKAVVLAALVAISMVAAPTAVALSTDTETTNSPGQSDLTDSSTITEPHNSSQTYRIQITGDSNTNTSALSAPESEMTMRVIVNDSDSAQDGEVLFEDTSNYSVTTVSGAPNHYYTNVTNTDWSDDLEYGATQNVTVDFRTVFNESESDESVHNISATVAPNGTDARVEFDADTRTLEDTNASTLSSLPGFGGDLGAAQVNQTGVGVTNTTQNITLDIDNQSAMDSFSESNAEADSGAFLTTSYVLVDGNLVPVFSESAGDQEWLNTDEDTYATLSSDGGELVIRNANETFSSDTSSVDVTATGNEAIGLFNTFSLLRDYGASASEAASASTGALDPLGNPEGFAEVEA